MAETRAQQRRLEPGVLFFRPRDVERIAGISRATIHRLIKHGKLKALQFEGLQSIRISRASLEAFLDEWKPVEGSIRPPRSPGRPRKKGTARG